MHQHTAAYLHKGCTQVHAIAQLQERRILYKQQSLHTRIARLCRGTTAVDHQEQSTGVYLREYHHVCAT